MLKPGDAVTPCRHLRGSWSIGNDDVDSYWEQAQGERRWFVGCQMCSMDASRQHQTLAVYLARES